MVVQVTEEEYLHRERVAERKSEFLHGEIFLMPGGSIRHARLGTNWVVTLSHAVSSPFTVYNSELRVRTLRTGSYVYPDASVFLGQPECYNGADDIAVNPSLVVEVLSASAADYDRGLKFELYREVPALREYILCHQASVHVEHFSRQSDGTWASREYRGLEEVIALTCATGGIRVSQIYAGGRF